MHLVLTLLFLGTSRSSFASSDLLCNSSALLGGEKELKQSRAGKRWRDGPVSFPWKMAALSPLLDATAQSMEKRKKERNQLHMGLRRGINNAGWGLLTGSDCIGAWQGSIMGRGAEMSPSSPSGS